MIPPEIIEQIKERASIEEVVGEYVTLRRRGANLIGLCPFHNEKTGSFTVSPSKGIYKCFGCGKAGNAVSFVMEIEHCSYIEAIKRLGKKYHIDIPEREMSEEEKRRQDDRESVFAVNDFCQKWFEQQLQESTQEAQAAKQFLLANGIQETTIEKYRLGYAPETDNTLSQTLVQKGFKEHFFVLDTEKKMGTGVSFKNEQGNLCDLFRGRIIFPMLNNTGKIIGFGGRIVKENPNIRSYGYSPNSIVYTKEKALYGLYQANSIASKNLCYIVETELDVLSIYQAGISNIVGLSGQTISIDQLEILKKRTSNVVLISRSDVQSINNALKIVAQTLQQNMTIKVVLLPKDETASTFVKQNDAAYVIEYLAQNQMDFVDFILFTQPNSQEMDISKQNRIIAFLKKYINAIPDAIAKMIYLKKIAYHFHREVKDLDSIQ